jgi:predicted nucleic acid-binding Zn ribbon protein
MTARRKDRSGGKRKLTAIDEVIRELMGRLEMPEDMDQKGKVFAGWEAAAGPAADHSNPFRFRGSTLVVEVDGPAWMNELGMRKRELVDRLNREAGGEIVKDIRFQLKKEI